MRSIEYTYEDETLGEVTLDITYKINPYKKSASGVEILKISEDGVEVEVDRSLLFYISEYILESDEDDISDEYYNDEDN